MIAINKGYENEIPEYSSSKNIRICIEHFHSSVIKHNNNCNYELVTGASPIMYLTKFSFDNENYAKDKTLPRSLGSTEDIQCVYDYETNENIYFNISYKHSNSK